MQFHGNGFRTGDPDVLPPREGAAAQPGDAPLPAETDVLIVGCGPAGLTLAAQLAAFPEIRTCIAEAKPGPLELGQADGVACRTMEMFQAFGFAEKVLREAYWVNETAFWKPGPGGGIERGGKIDDTEPGLSEFPHVILNQARVHRFFLDRMRNSPTRLSPYYERRLIDLKIDRTSEYPVTARFEHGEKVEIVRAKYAVGCDGARSTVRRELGLVLKGDSANQAWGVMDVLAVTDFPDIRLKAVINSARDGSIVLIPREGGYLVRIYVELDDLAEGERASTRNMSFDHIVAAANKVLAPYTIDVREVAWWSIYEIGQRLCDRFDDLGEDSAADTVPRVFIAGDACHTHSPKAGQGMNVSMQDAFNLGWKLAAVLRGQSPPQLLRTYSEERQVIAGELIAFDKEWAAMLSAPVKVAGDPDSPGLDPAEVQAYFVRQGRYTAGTATRYAPALLTGGSTHQGLAEGFQVGTRFHSAPVVRLGDARPMQLGHAFEADGSWRVLAFAGAGDPLGEGSAIRKLCDALPALLARHTPEGADVDAVIDVRAVFQQPHRSLDIGQLPGLLHPAKGRLGLRDYEKVFCADPRAGDIFDLRGIDRDQGCLVVIRPDQYVAQVLPIDGLAELSDFFGSFMVKQAALADA